MNIDESYVLKKEVDWSLLNDGLTIPIAYQVVFSRNMGRFLERGEKKTVHIILNGNTYRASITNLKFDEVKYKRNPIIQLRYSTKSDLARALRKIFNCSYEYFQEQRALQTYHGRIRLPEYMKEYLVIYTTVNEDTYIFETITCSELNDIKSLIVKEKEVQYEAEVNYNKEDKSADILLREGLVKVRKLSRAIGDNLKELYGYRCQICGEQIGVKYGASIVEAHHIEYFVKSLNNDASNQIIVCPNHHSIIHATNPKFVKDKKVFVYPNGVIEKLVLNRHL